MIDAAGSIFPKARIGSLMLEKYLSETDAEVIPTKGYGLIDITQAGGAETRGLANGEEGQVLIMVNTVHAANVVVTPSSLANGATITFDALYDACELVFLRGAWYIINLYGTCAVA